ncbi:Vitellogenin-1 [Leptosomus discolor]|uniref:Vitellogenin-1 n=1 Tax=Leptosomus discolor TaxID=188344 RepID=A0A091R0G9_LEPDC|nr:Vitellogenin-1 [Leptosomus discolor]
MRGLILALVLTLVGSQQLNYQPDFSENKVYTFDYESMVLSGLPEKGLARAGIRIKSKVEISGIGPKLCLIRIHSIEAAEYNGVWPASSFSRSLKLTQVLTGQLSNPIKFEYSGGHVGNLMAPDSVSDDGLNIYRGVLNVLELSLKKMQHSYSLQEAGLGGICNTTYAIQENKRASLVYVTKSKDLNSCEEKVQMVTGSAYTRPCQPCQQRNKNSRATATYDYKIKYTRNEAVITQADVEEIHQFAPFNEITGGNAVVEVRQKLSLTDVQKQTAEVPPKEFQSRGSLRYQFGSELLQLPVHLFRIKNVESQIEESLQDLVETTSEQLPSDAPAKALKLVHLFRAANEENYESVWKQFSSRPAYRRFFLDIVSAVASHRALRFLRQKMERQELTNWEVAQTVLVALHSSPPTRDVMEEATLIVKKHCPRSSTALGKVCHLSYASLCHKQCSSSDSCSECLQLLHGFAGEALSKSDTEDISLALKALGNVGHPASIKHIKKFLPGYAAGASDLPLKVHATAVMALKNIGLKDPKMVQAITLEIFLNCKIHPRVRMLAAVVLLETKPGLPIVMTLAEAVLKESSMQVASFIYSHLRALGRSTAPDLQAMASACRMAVRALSSQFDRSGYQFSKVFRFSMFKEFLMSGLAAKYLVLNNAGSLIPVTAMSQLRTHFLGRVADPLEVGVTVEGLQEMFAKGYSPDRDWEADYDFKDILKTLSDWKAFSSDKPFASGYLKMFGQELFFGGLDKNAIQSALQAWYGPDEKIPSIRRIISSLQSGMGRQWTKAFLASEIRRIVPTCSGFPMETSFYYSSVTKVAGNVQAQITPSPKSDFRLTDLLNANIRLRSKMSLSIAKEMTFVMGINTHMIQAGLEAHTKTNAHVPVNVVAAVRMKEKDIKIEIPPCKDETNVITVRSKTFAVTRNIGDLAASKMTPVLLPEAVPDIMKASFDSDSASGETDNIRDRQPAEDVSSGNSFSVGSSPSQKEPFVQSMCSNASTFGVQVCVERKSVHAAFIKNVPLYYLVGEHALQVSFKPVYTEAPIEKIQVTIQAGDQAPTKMVRLVTFEAPEAQVSSSKDAIRRVKKILDDTNDQGTRKSRSSSSSASSASGSAESTTSSPSSSDSDNREASSAGSSSAGSSSSSSPPGVKGKAKQQSKATALPRASAAEGERSVREQRRKARSSRSSSSRSSSSSSESTGASRRHSQYYSRAEAKSARSQSNSSYGISTKWEYRLPKVYQLRFRPAHVHWHPDHKISSSSSSSSSEWGSSRSNSSSSRSSSRGRRHAGHGSRRSRGTSTHHSHGSSWTRERNFLGDVIPPGIAIVAQAVRSDSRNQGYQATAYVRSHAAKVDVQLVVVQLAETDWKACADAVILPLKAQARLRWGKECRDYRIGAVATTGQLARKPAVQLKVQWGSLPSWIKKTSTAFMQYVPGAALVLGFSEAHQRNPSHEFIVRAAATSPRTIDTVIKAPGVTLYYQALRMPFTLPLGPSPTYETRDITAWNIFPEIASQIAQEDQSTCEVREGDFKTFDRVSHTYSFNKNCNLIVAQDCTEHPKFIIATRKVDPQSSSRVVHINTTSANITICPLANSSLLVACNEEQVLSHSGDSEYEKDNVKIYKNGATVIVEVPTHGLKKVTFDGVTLKVIVASWMRGRTCGVCGNNDREKHNELQMPNRKVAHSCSAFVHSWVLLEETCSGGCKLQRGYVKLDRNPTIDGEESTCYSADPVLKCMQDCTPVETAPVKVGFHCFPKDAAVSLLEWQRSSDKKSASEDVVESVDADVDCTCTGDCS